MLIRCVWVVFGLFNFSDFSEWIIEFSDCFRLFIIVDMVCGDCVDCS